MSTDHGHAVIYLPHETTFSRELRAMAPLVVPDGYDLSAHHSVCGVLNGCGVETCCAKGDGGQPSLKCFTSEPSPVHQPCEETQSISADILWHIVLIVMYI